MTQRVIGTLRPVKVMRPSLDLRSPDEGVAAQGRDHSEDTGGDTGNCQAIAIFNFILNKLHCPSSTSTLSESAAGPLNSETPEPPQEGQEGSHQGEGPSMNTKGDIFVDNFLSV